MTFTTENLRNIDIEKLRHFCLVYKNQSISKAAEKNNINVKILRHSLKTIESKLNIKLYYSTTRNLYPTEDAKNLYEICEEIIGLLNKYDNKIFKPQDDFKKSIELVIVSTTTLTHYFLQNAVTIFLSQHNNVTFKIFSGSEYINNRDFIFDVLISPLNKNSGLLSRKLINFEYKLYCTKFIKEKIGDVNSIKDIKGQDILLFSGEHFLDEDFIKNNTIKVISNSYPFLLNMCLNNQGIISCFDMNNLNKIFNSIDIIPLIDDYITEKEDVYFHFHRLNDKIQYIEKFYDVVNKIFIEYKGETNDKN